MMGIGLGEIQEALRRKEKASDTLARLTFLKSLTIGSNWYVKLPGAVSVVEIAVVDVTEKTIALRLIFDTNVTRYKISDIDFVEKTSS